LLVISTNQSLRDFHRRSIKLFIAQSQLIYLRHISKLPGGFSE